MNSRAIALTLILATLTAFITLSALLRHTLPRETAETAEAVVIVGVVGVAFLWGAWGRRRG